MKKKALGLTDIAIPSVPYERGKMSDDNYEKSILFFGKDTLDSGNPNSQPNINQIFEKEPDQPLNKEKIMKKKRFLKIKSLKKMASSNEKDQKTIEGLKQKFDQINGEMEKFFAQKTATGSLRRNLSLYKRGGKIWSFLYKIAAEPSSGSLDSALSSIDSYFNQNIDEALPKIKLINNKGGINYPYFASSASTFEGAKKINILFDQVFYSSEYPEDAEDASSKKIRSEIIKKVLSEREFFSGKIQKFGYIDNLIAGNGDITELPEDLLKAINRYYTSGEIDGIYKPVVSGKQLSPKDAAENLKAIYQKMMEKIVINDSLTERMSVVNKNRDLADALKKRLQKNFSLFGGDSSRQDFYSKKYLELLKKVHALETEGNQGDILRFFDQMDQKIADYSQRFAAELASDSTLTTYLETPTEAVNADSIKATIKQSLFSPAAGYGSELSLRESYLRLVKGGSLAQTDKSKGKKEKKKSSPPTGSTDTSSRSAASPPVSDAPTDPSTSRTVPMTSVFDPDDSETSADSESDAMKNTNELEAFLNEELNRVEARGYFSADQIRKIRESLKIQFSDLKSKKETLNTTVKDCKKIHLELDNLYDEYSKYIDDIHDRGFNDPAETRDGNLKKLNYDLDIARLTFKIDDFKAKYNDLRVKLDEAIARSARDAADQEAEKNRIKAEEAEEAAKVLREQARLDAEKGDFEAAQEKLKQAQQLLAEREELLKKYYEEKVSIYEAELEREKAALKKAAEKEAAGFKDQAESLRREAQESKDAAEQLRKELQSSKEEVGRLVEEGKQSAEKLRQIQEKLTELEARVGTTDPETIRLELGEGSPRGSGGTIPDAPKGRLIGAKNFAVALALFGTVIFFGLKGPGMMEESASEDLISGLMEAVKKTYLFNKDEFSTAAINSIKENNDQQINQYLSSLKAEFKKSLIAVGFTERSEEETALSSGQSLSIVEKGVTIRGVPFIDEGLTVDGRSNNLGTAISRTDSIIEMLRSAYNEEKKNYYAESSTIGTTTRTDDGSAVSTDLERPKPTISLGDPLELNDRDLFSFPTSKSTSSDWNDYAIKVADSGYQIPKINGKFGIEVMWSCVRKTMRDYDDSYTSYKKYTTNVFGSTHDPEKVFKRLKQICDAISGSAARPQPISQTTRTAPPISSTETIRDSAAVKKPITNIGEITRGKYYYIDSADVAEIIEPIKSTLSKKGGGKPVSLKMNIHSSHQLSVPKDPKMLRKVPFVIEKISIRYGAINPFEINYFYDTPDFITIIKNVLSEENVGKIKLT